MTLGMTHLGRAHTRIHPSNRHAASLFVTRLRIADASSVPNHSSRCRGSIGVATEASKFREESGPPAGSNRKDAGRSMRRRYKSPRTLVKPSRTREKA
jgi:hypothetical protein